MRKLIFAVFFALLLVFPAVSERRAFVVGVGDYDNLIDLRKTIGDAEGYSAVFGTELGYQTTTLKNPTRAEFSAAFGSFLERIAPGDEVVFVFSGHGWSDGAENYLVLSDAPKEASEYVLKDETQALTNGVLAQIKQRDPRLVFAIVDACRDNPFDSLTKSALRKGLVRADVTEGTLVLFAAGTHQRALDRLSASDASHYSVFTRVLLPKLRQTRRPIQEIAREVKDEVRELADANGFEQRPAYYDELNGSYCLSGICDRPDKVIVQPDNAALEERIFNQIMEAPSEESLSDFIARGRRGELPGNFISLAETELSRIRAARAAEEARARQEQVEYADYQSAIRARTSQGYRDFLAKHPSGKWASTVRRNLNGCKVETVNTGQYRTDWIDYPYEKKCSGFGACLNEPHTKYDYCDEARDLFRDEAKGFCREKGQSYQSSDIDDTRYRAGLNPHCTAYGTITCSARVPETTQVESCP